MTKRSGPTIQFESVYEEAFVRRSHELVGMGYTRLSPCSLAHLDETAITGCLVDAMEAALDAPDRPDWATHFTAMDDPPVSVDGKTGKRRPRIDVIVRCINPRPSISFRFEAKRLHTRQSLTRYLGNDGLLALVTGHYGNLSHAGMLGYVQSETCSAWSGRIQQTITEEPAMYHARTPVSFGDLGLSVSDPVFTSQHEFGQPLKQHLISHTLLACA